MPPQRPHFPDDARVKGKLLMVAGMGLGKLAPLLFGLFLSRQFGAPALAGFVLLLTYVTALVALPTLGATPQIIRAGTHDDAAGAVVRAILASAMLLALMLAGSLLWWLGVAAQPLLALEVSPQLMQGWVALLGAALVCYGLAQSTAAQQERHFAIGAWSVVIYLGAAGAGMVAGVWPAALGAGLSGEAAAITVYCAGFLALTVLFFIGSQRPLRAAWRHAGALWRGAEVATSLRGAVSTSLFGLITLAGLYVLMHAAQQRMAATEDAIFALAFQLFQAGIFLPSVLGAIVVPRLVAAGHDGAIDAAALHRRTRAVYLGIGIAWLLASLLVARPLLALYGLDAAGATGLVLMQVAAVLAGLQAYFIQRFVAAGSFGLLASASLLWAVTGYVVLMLAPPGLLGSVLALVAAYVACLAYYGLRARGEPA